MFYGLENQFVKDTIRQLKSGMHCYIFKLSQLEEIKEKYKESTGIDLVYEIEKEEYYYIIRPKKKLTGRQY